MNTTNSKRIAQWLRQTRYGLSVIIIDIIISGSLIFGIITLFHLKNQWALVPIFVGVPFVTGFVTGMLEDISFNFLSGLLIKVRVQSIFPELSVWGLTGIAAILAGHRRLTLREEWAAHLAGESGHDRANWQKVKQAFGFVVSAVQYRCSDMADAAWTPFDAVLKSRKLSNLLVFAPTAIAAYIVLHHEGTLGVVKAAESVTAIGSMLYGLVRLGRWWRDVKPPEPKARRAKE